MKMKILLAAAILCTAPLVTGCVSLGMSQADAEKAYTAGATLTDGAILLGKLTPEYVGTACTVDNLNYGNLAATRNIADGAGTLEAASDAIHAKLQTDGAKFNPACTPPPPISH